MIMPKHTERSLALVPCTLAMARKGMGPGSQLTKGPDKTQGGSLLNLATQLGLESAITGRVQIQHAIDSGWSTHVCHLGLSGSGCVS